MSTFSRARLTGLRLAGLGILALAAAPALAADFDGGYAPPRPDYGGGYERRLPPPPPPEPEFRGPRFSAGPRFVPPPDACRVFVKRRFDEDGEPVLRRVRVCDEPSGFEGGPRHRPDFDGPPPRDGFPHRRWGWDGPRW
ncbi:hypothetical protein [Methylobacterium trifolii]|uniref:hypothetical protein n=1 Tax=Methylobacterium trifolii TaxID=1003092 RepID=UPI001EDCEBB8|nr:hypothetical protein [Methylobacterium trifolii]